METLFYIMLAVGSLLALLVLYGVLLEKGNEQKNKLED